MRPGVAIASCAQFAGTEKEDHRVIDALRARGVSTTHAAWDDRTVDWSSFALVVIRSTWDYPQRLGEFLVWASSLRHVLNPFPILKWNTDKHYLNDLAKTGMPVIPTKFLEPEDLFELPMVPFVVKPAVSCGAKDTARYDVDQGAKAMAHVRRLQAEGRTVMVQPYLSDIERTGEVSLIFIGAQFSHAVWRGAVLNDQTSQKKEIEYAQDARAHEATPEERRLGDQVLSHIPGGPAGLLYARIDVIPTPTGTPMLLEAELTEPTLFLEYSEDGVDRLAECIVSALTDRD
jgi:glutathione synthase/RimK-type ligase-like ATP-grasp enzyme